MNRLLFSLTLLIAFSQINAQTTYQNNLDKDFHVAFLRREANPYQGAVSESFKLTNSGEKDAPDSVIYKPVLETYDYWDNNSASWIPNYRFEKSYSNTGKLLLSDQYNYSSATQSELTLRSIFTYDNYGFQAEEIEQSPDVTSGQLVNVERDVQQHEVSGNPIFEQISFWDTYKNDWLYNHQHSYFYDSLDREILILHSNYDSSQNIWSPYQKYSSLYNSTGNLIHYLGFEWNDSSSLWLKQSNDSIIYDSGNRRIHEELFLIPEGSNSLTPYISYDYSYDDEGRLIQSNTSFWNLLMGQYDKYDQTSYSFNERGLLSQLTYQQWDAAASSWKNYSQRNFIYDDNNYMVGDIISSWTGSVWAASFQYLYTNDESGNLMQSVGQIWNSSLQSWVNDERYTAEYAVFTGIPSNPDSGNKVSVYPNPANATITIQGLNKPVTVLLMDANGKMAAQFNKVSGAINVTMLDQGAYLLKALSENGKVIFSQKLLIVK